MQETLEFLSSMLVAILTVVFVLVLVLVVLGIMFFMFSLLRANDFPHRRRYCKSRAKLNGKTVIVTGSNAGIGYETAKDLAKRGARVILACRSMDKANRAKQQIIDGTGNHNIMAYPLDLSDLDSVRAFATKVIGTENKLHILVNNAGIVFDAKHPKTKQGFDMVFGTNHLGHFLLTYLLLDLLKASSHSRVVNVSSLSYVDVKTTLDFTEEDNQGNAFPNLHRYPISKIANILHAKELAHRCKDTGVTTYSLHPGFVDTDIVSTLEGGYPAIFVYLMKLSARVVSINVWTGVQCTLYCALEESLETVSGLYYENCKEKIPEGEFATDRKLAKQLWEVSMKMAGICE